MSSFSASWLELREASDRRARSDELVAQLRSAYAASARLRLLDLGAGTAANLRYLASRLGGTQHWTLIDQDAGLLESAQSALRRWAEEQGYAVSSQSDTLHIAAESFACRIDWLVMNLATRLDDLPLDDGCIVTASALLDLVSSAWLTELANRCHARHTGILCALSYNGRMRVAPSDPLDELTLDLFNRHQRTNKGFGPALGPAAADFAKDALGAIGYRVATRPSDWRLAEADETLQSELLDGWLQAALETGRAHAAELNAWADRRRRLISAGRSRIVVGHEDLLALPA